MGTSASITLVQPCDNTVLTAAQVIALRNAGGLRVDCHYRVQGPVIGTPGNTSATIVELHAVTPSTLSKEAKVWQTFNPEGAFIGSYDPDADTAGGGTLNRLIDHWDNDVSDEDAGNAASHTVHNQFPYHLSSTNLRDNVINDCNLTGWPIALGAGAQITDNDLRESTIDLTGLTQATGPASRFARNRVDFSTISLQVAKAFVNDNQCSTANITHLGTGAGSFSFQNNAMPCPGTVNVDATTTGQITMNRNIWGGTTNGTRVGFTGLTASAILSGNRLFGIGGAVSYDLDVRGSGSVQVIGNEMTAVEMLFDGSGLTNLTSNRCTGTRVNQQGGPLTVNRNTLGTVQLNTGAANAALTNTINDCNIGVGLVQLNGPAVATGRNDFNNVNAPSVSITVAATASAGVLFSGGFYNLVGGAITQNRTSGSVSTAFFDCDMRGFTTVTDNGTTDPTQTLNFNRCQFRDTVVNLGNIAAKSPGGTIAQQLDCIGSTLNITGLGGAKLLDKGRLTGASLTNGGFQVTTFEMLGGTKTMTADQSNRLFNPAFDNWI
ncbi:hypothetical protein SEA_MISCHIEF19_21 [Streptomyces phage Mischief19]|nr:hypothetical protein SEA_MISCHIEF19_21 [Streptomyces phage Mischief19]